MKVYYRNLIVTKYFGDQLCYRTNFNESTSTDWCCTGIFYLFFFITFICSKKICFFLFFYEGTIDNCERIKCLDNLDYIDNWISLNKRFNNEISDDRLNILRSTFKKLKNNKKYNYEKEEDYELNFSFDSSGKYFEYCDNLDEDEWSDASSFCPVSEDEFEDETDEKIKNKGKKRKFNNI